MTQDSIAYSPTKIFPSTQLAYLPRAQSTRQESEWSNHSYLAFKPQQKSKRNERPFSTFTISAAAGHRRIYPVSLWFGEVSRVQLIENPSIAKEIKEKKKKTYLDQPISVFFY